MSASISRYLKDFSPPKADRTFLPPKYFPDLDDDLPGRGAFDMPQPLSPPVDIEAERRDAAAQARRSVEREQMAMRSSEIAALQARHAAEIEAMRVRCDNEIAAMIYDRFCDMGSQLAEMLSDQAARVLAPVMSDVLSRKSVGDLARAVRQSIAAGEGCKVTVTGPAALYTALKTHLDDDTLIFRHQPSEDIDLSVEFGDAVLVTRMAAWVDTVGKVLA